MNTRLKIDSDLPCGLTGPKIEAIPDNFCWTKMGAETGQQLGSILWRKELERLSGGGIFSWGIGNSIAPAIAAVKNKYTGKGMPVLFSPMKSAPKEIDVAPSGIVVWLSYIESDGSAHELPAHMLITSRQNGPSGSQKRGHYALICRKAEPIQMAAGANSFIDSSLVRNYVSEEAVGSSQVTSVVKYAAPESTMARGQYPVLFRAELCNQWFVRLADPIAIEGALLKQYHEICLSRCPDEWSEGLLRFKRDALQRVGKKIKRTQLALL